MPAGFERIELLGDRVRLRPIREADAADAYRLLTDDAVLANLAWDGPASEAEIAGTYTRWQTEFKAGENCCLAIERADKPGMVGCINARFPRHPMQADIGYWLGVPYWNQGYMTEAVRLVCHLSFGHLNAARAYATVFTRNMASRRVLEKNGFSVDGTLRSHVFKRGQFVDSWFLTLLRSEWEVRKERYAPRHEEVIVAEGE
jgi:ribosomal-protein-alanine N-acetyltransferase